MKPSQPLAACATLLLLGMPIIAGAGPGDPRLVNGVVEWPAVVTNEPFLIVRGDEGVLYYVAITATRREGAVAAGSRVVVLGLEGRSPHEITAIGMGSGPSTEAALAQLQGARPPAPTAPAAPAGSPSPASAAPAAPAPAAAPANETMTPAAPKAAAPATPAPRHPGAPSPTSVTADARVRATGAEPAVVPASTPPRTEVVMAPLPSIAATPTLLPTDDQRWVELAGEVETVLGRTLVLKVDGGRVSVDVSSLGGNLERIVAPGSMVKVYGVPVELRFKAMGFIDSDVRAPRSRQH